MSIAHNEVVEYPESDGKPMGETDLHIYWIVRLRDLLKTHYQGQQVYVGADLLVYYEQGNPKKFVVPDVFVVLDCPPGNRRTFRIWEEGRVPSVVFEISSRSTAENDLIDKPKLYAKLGVEEYFLFDPEADYLDPPLRGFRLQGGEMVEMAPSAGRLQSSQCRCHLRLEDRFLELLDIHTGESWLTEVETAEHVSQLKLDSYRGMLDSYRGMIERECQTKEQERAEKEQEREQRLAAEAENIRLRAEIERLKKSL